MEELRVLREWMFFDLVKFWFRTGVHKLGAHLPWGAQKICKKGWMILSLCS